MAKVDLEALREMLSNARDDENVIDLLSEFVPAPELTGDQVRDYLDTKDGKRLLQPIVDKRVSEAIETYKGGHFKDEVDAAVKTRLNELNPPETDADRRIRELEERIAKSDAERARSEFRAQVLTEANKRGVPTWWVDTFAGDTMEAASAFMDAFEEHTSAKVKSEVETRLASGPKPKAEPPQPGKPGNLDDLRNMTQDQIVALEEAGELNEYLSK